MELAALHTEMVEPGILLVKINRPDRANALNTQMGREICHVFEGLLLDPGDTRCVIITGNGKHFCAGGDMDERAGMSDSSWQKQHAIFERAFYALMDCPIPVIAAVNGAAFGGGCEIALCCDFIYAANTARFALTETSLGIIPGGGGTQNLPRAVGRARARELIFTALPFDATQAHSWGMVNRVVPADALLDEAFQAAKRIASNAPIALRRAKRAIALGAEVDLKTGLGIEIEAYNGCVPTSDRREGIAAFQEKRSPRFLGE